jgi:hypothetical protein
MNGSLHARKWQIESARRQKARELMKEYDETVYRPALAALVVECSAVGHFPNERWNFTVGGEAYQRCGSCGKTLWEKEGEPAL